MADEIRVTRVGEEEVHRVAGTPAGEEGPLVIDAKEEIQATRARISGTIDEIEEVLRRKRDRIEQRLDILAPVRDRPLQVLGAVFAAGLVLGLLTGGGDEEEEERPRKGKGRGGRRGREEGSRWESRTRRLLRIAREQEEELASLRRRAARRPARPVVEDGDYEIEDDYDYDRYEDGYDDDDGETGEGGTAMDRLKGYVMEHVSGLAVEAVQQLVRRAGRG